MGILDNLEYYLESNGKDRSLVACQECGGKGFTLAPSSSDESEPIAIQCQNCLASGTAVALDIKNNKIEETNILF